MVAHVAREGRRPAEVAGGDEVSDEYESEEAGEYFSSDDEDEDDEDDGVEADGTPTPDGEDAPLALPETFPETPCPRCSSARTQYRYTQSQTKGAVTRWSCRVRLSRARGCFSDSLTRTRASQDCDKTWVTSVRPWKEVRRLAFEGAGVAAQRARVALRNRPKGRRASRAAPVEVTLKPKKTTVVADVDACELPTVAPRLWIGAATAAADLEWLRAHGITHIVNVAAEVPDFYPDELTYHSMSFRDCADDMKAMMDALPAAHAFIDSALASGGGVLVHCRMGLSRSAAVAASYGMQRGVALSDTLAALKEGRNGLSLNFAFQAMLELLQQKHAGIEGVRNTRSRLAR